MLLKIKLKVFYRVNLLFYEGIEKWATKEWKSKVKVSQESSKGNLNNNQIDYLNELYNRYNKIRHPYAHWAEDSMDTQVITDVKTAHDLILEGSQFVNKHYILF